MASTVKIVGLKWIQYQVLYSTGKTDVWQVAARDKGPTMLGVVKWFGRWRKYCFFPNDETVFEQDCLRDIANFCEYLTNEHRKRLEAMR